MPLLRLSFALALALPSAAQTGAPSPIAVEVPIEIARDLRLRPESGDVIQKANGADVGARDIIRGIEWLPPEPIDVPIVVRRDNRAVTLLLRIPAIPEGNRWTLADSTATAPFILEASELETLRGAAGEAAIAALIEDASTNVVSIGTKEASTFAMRHALEPGDELVSIEGMPIAKRADVRAALGRVAALKSEVVRLELRRGGVPRRHDYRLHWTAAADVVRLGRPRRRTGRRLQGAQRRKPGGRRGSRAIPRRATRRQIDPALRVLSCRQARFDGVESF